MGNISQLLNEIEKSSPTARLSLCRPSKIRDYPLKKLKSYLRKSRCSQPRTCVPFILGETDQKIVRESHSVSWHFFLASI